MKNQSSSDETKSHKQYLRELSEREEYRERYSKEYIQKHPAMKQIIRICHGKRPNLPNLMKNILGANHPEIQKLPPLKRSHCRTIEMLFFYIIDNWGILEDIFETCEPSKVPIDLVNIQNKIIKLRKKTMFYFSKLILKNKKINI